MADQGYDLWTKVANPVGPNGLPVAVMQSAARRRAEECVMRGERCPDLVKQIGALRLLRQSCWVPSRLLPPTKRPGKGNERTTESSLRRTTLEFQTESFSVFPEAPRADRAMLVCRALNRRRYSAAGFIIDELDRSDSLLAIATGSRGCFNRPLWLIPEYRRPVPPLPSSAVVPLALLIWSGVFRSRQRVRPSPDLAKSLHVRPS